MGMARVELAPRWTYRIRKRGGMWELEHCHVYPEANRWDVSMEVRSSFWHCLVALAAGGHCSRIFA